MAVQGSDETGLTNGVDYYFRYNIDDAGFTESSINPDLSPAVPEATLIEAVDDVSGSLESTYFELNSPTVDYYVWMNNYTAAIPATEETTEILFNHIPVVAANAPRGRYWTLNPVSGSGEYYVWYNQITPAADNVSQVVHMLPTWDSARVAESTSHTLSRFSYLRIESIADDKIILVGADINGSNYGTAQIFTVTSENRLTPLTPTKYVWNSVATYQTAIVKLATDKAFIVYNEGFNSVKAIIATITGSAIAYGTPQTIATVSSADLIKASILPGTENVAILYNNNLNEGYSVVCQVSGTTITVGTPLQITGVENNFISESYADIAGMTEDCYLIATKANLPEDNAKYYLGGEVAVVRYDSATGTISIGDFYGGNTGLNSTSISSLAIGRIDSSRALLFQVTGAYYRQAFVVKIADGDVVSFSERSESPQTASPRPNTYLALKTAGKYFSVVSRDSSGYARYVIGAIDGDKPTVTDEDYFTSILRSYVTMCNVESGGSPSSRFIFMGADSGGSYSNGLDLAGNDSGIEGTYINLDDPTTPYYFWYGYDDIDEVTDVTLFEDLNGAPTLSYTSGWLWEFNAPAFSRIKELDTNQVITASTMDAGPTVHIGDVTSDNISWAFDSGYPVSGTPSKARLALLTTSTFAIAERNSASAGGAAVGSLSSGAVTWGSRSVYSASTVTSLGLFATEIDSTHFVVSYRDTGSPYEQWSTVATVSGTTITGWSSLVDTGERALNYGDMINIDSTHVMFLSTSANVERLIIGTYTAGNMSWDTPFDMTIPIKTGSTSSNFTGFCNVCKIDSTRYLVSGTWRDYVSFVTYYSPVFVLVSIDGSYNITQEDVIRISELETTTSRVSGTVEYLGSNTFVSHFGGTSSSYRLIGHLNLVDNTIEGVSIIQEDTTEPGQWSISVQNVYYPLSSNQFYSIAYESSTSLKPVGVVRTYNKGEYNSKYWYLSNPSTDYYVWYNRSAGAEVFDIKVTAGDGDHWSDYQGEILPISTPQALQVSKIGATSAVLGTFAGGSSEGHRIGTIVGSNTVTWETLYTFDTAITQSNVLTTLISDTAFVTVYSRNSTDTYSIVGSISGTTITYGSATDVGNDAPANFQVRYGSLIKLDSTHVLFFFMADTTAYPTYKIGTITGTAISWAAAVTVRAGVSSGIGAVDLETTSPSRFILSYDEYFQLGSWNGSAITLGLKSVSLKWDPSSNHGKRTFKQIDTTHVIYCEQEYSATYYNDWLTVITLNADYDTMLFSEWVENDHGTQVDNIYKSDFAVLSSSKIAYSYLLTISQYGHVRMIDLDASYNITLGQPIPLETSTTQIYDIKLAPISSTKYVCLYYDPNSGASVKSRVGDSTEAPFNESYFDFSAPATDYYAWFSAPKKEVTKVQALDQGPNAGSTATLTASTSYGTAGVAKLTSTTCIATYISAPTTTVLRSKVGTITPSTLAISWGTEYVDGPTYNQSFSSGAMCNLDSTHVIVVYTYQTGGTTNEFYGMVLTEAAGAITYSGSPGANTSIAAAGDSRSQSVKLLDSTHCIFCCITGSQVIAIAGSISGTTITWGSSVTIDSAATNQNADLDVLDSTHAIIVWSGYSSTRKQAAVLSISGTTITKGTEFAMDATSGTSTVIVTALDSTHFLASFHSTASGTSGMHGAVGTVSGTTVTGMTESVFFTAGATYYHHMAALSSSKVAYGYAGGNSIGPVRIDSVFIDNFTDVVYTTGSTLDASAAYAIIDTLDSDIAVIVSNQASPHAGWACAPFQNTLDGTYFTINDPTTSYYVWFDLDNTSTDPAPGGTGIEINVTSADSAATVASTLQTAMDGETDFSASVSSELVTITNANAGNVTDAADVDSQSPVFVSSQGTNATDPAPGGTGIQIDIDPGASANTIASALQSDINSETDFSATVLTDTVTVTNANAGEPNAVYYNLAQVKLTTTTYGSDASVDPTVAGRTGISVSYTGGSSANAMATSTQTAVNAHASFSASVLADTVTVTSAASGPANERPASFAMASYVITTAGQNATTDPAPGGRTGVKMSIDGTETLDDIFTLVQTTINSEADFSAETVTASSAGIDWTAETAAGSFTGTFSGINNAKSSKKHGSQSPYIAVGSLGEIQISFDGIDWFQQTAAGSYTGNFSDCISGFDIQDNLIHVAFGQTGEIQTSRDGLGWTQRVAAGSYTSTFLCGAAIKEKFIIAGQNAEIQTSEDGVTWTQRTPDASYSGNFNGAAYGNGLFILVGDSGEIQTSPDGITWTQRTAAGSYSGNFQTVGWGGGTFVAAGSGPEIQTSPDGTTWTQRTPVGASTFYGHAYGDGLHILVGASGVVESSPDGVTWTSRTTTGTSGWNEITFGGHGFVAAGNSGEIERSITVETKYIRVKNANTGAAADPADNNSGTFLANVVPGTASASQSEDTDPAPGGKTGIEILVDDGEGVYFWTGATDDVIDNMSDFNVVQYYNELTISNDATGPTTDATVGTMNDTATTISTLTITQQGGDFVPESNSTDPAPGGRTGIEVKYTENDLAGAIQSAIVTSVDAEADFIGTPGAGGGEIFEFVAYRTGSSLGGDYFAWESPPAGGGGNEKWKVWFQSGKNKEPPLSGYTAIQVSYSTLDKTTSIASKTKTAIDGSAASVTTTLDSSRVIIENDEAGNVPDAFSNITNLNDVWIDQQGTSSLPEIWNVGSYDPFEEAFEGRYFTFTLRETDNGNQLNYYVWHNFSGNSTDPAPGGTGIEITTMGVNWSNTWKDAIDASSASSYCSVVASLSSSNYSYITVTNTFDGDVTDVDIGTLPRTIVVTTDQGGSGAPPTITNAATGTAPDAADVDTGFTLTVVQQGAPDTPLTTWDNIIPKLNAATSGGTWELYQEDIRLTTDSSGPGATVRLGSGLSGTNLFTSLTGFTSFDDPKDPYPA